VAGICVGHLLTEIIILNLKTVVFRVGFILSRKMAREGISALRDRLFNNLATKYRQKISRFRIIPTF
jgi:hypothetical protein